MESTLTVFIHGYKGNEYDLSKIKSHLILLLGCSHFYSIRGLNGEKAGDATIKVLGETAARELNTYLALAPTFRSINFIGFSLGGLIARAMLPHLHPHRTRLNLLLTIATPHLGLREVQNCLVRAGLCYMRRVAGIESIRELNSERDATACRYLLELAGG
jgi:triacylglycerol esterase/lipase EstA (alpha/beta hydrolase family)